MPLRDVPPVMSDADEAGEGDDGGDGDEGPDGAAGGGDAAAASTASDGDDPLAGVDPAEHPVVLFDGVCNLCHAGIRFIVRHDDAGVFRFAPLTSPVGQALLERHGLPTEEFESFVVVDGSGAYRKSDAVLRVARDLEFPWRLLRVARYVPRGVRDRLYDAVAEHRYQVFGQKDACTIPEPEVRERVVARVIDGTQESQ